MLKPKRLSFCMLVLVSLTFFTGCLGGANIGVGEQYKMGNVVLTIAHTGSLKDGGVSALLVPTEATHARIAFIGGGFDRIIVEDVAIPAGGKAVLEMQIPVGTYEVHGIAYRQYADTHGNKYGIALTGNRSTGLVVSEANTTALDLNLEKFALNITAPSDYVFEGRTYSIRYRNANYNGLYAPSLDSYELMTSRQMWPGDTEINLPNDLQVQGSVYSSYYSSYQFSNSMPNEYGAVIYYQIRAQLSTSYQNSAKYASGKQGLTPLYVYFPSTTSGEPLGTVKTPPLGDVNIGIN